MSKAGTPASINIFRSDLFMNEIILTTPEQLDEIIQQAVKKALSSVTEDKPQKIPNTCSVEQALAFLSENGYKLSKSKLQKLTANKILPFRYFGRWIIFSRDALLQWIEKHTISSSNPDEALLVLAASARRKTRE